jgi:hypothetical protein
MKSVKPKFVNCACAILLMGLAASAPAQTIWNYDISDAGNGNSLVTWSVTGDLASPSGAVMTIYLSSVPISVVAPGIYTGTIQADGTIPTPDGSSFQYGFPGVYTDIVGYGAESAVGNGNDSFGLVAPLLPRIGVGQKFVYNPGTQSVIIPVDFSNFNPGTYQSQEAGFATPLTVNLTVEPVPEPSTLALAGVVITFAIRKQR